MIKNPGGEDDEEDEEDEEKPPLATDEEYLHDLDSGRLDNLNLQYFRMPGALKNKILSEKNTSK